jgi:hypothetical protein
MRESNSTQVSQNTEILVAIGRAEERAHALSQTVNEHHMTLYSVKPPGIVKELDRVVEYVDTHRGYEKVFIGSVIVLVLTAVASAARFMIWTMK